MKHYFSTVTLRTLLFSILICGIFSSCSNREQTVAVALEYLPETVDLDMVHEELRTQIEDATEQAISRKSVEEAIQRLSRLYHANGFLQEAIGCYEALLLLEPDEARWKHLLASIFSTYGYADDAESLWLETIIEVPDYIPARIRLGDVYLKSNRLEEAEVMYEASLQQDTKNPYAFVGLARIEILNENWELAKKYLESASDNSKGRIGRDLLVIVHEKLGETYQAFAIRGESRASGSHVDIEDPWLNEVMKDCYDPIQLMNFGGFATFAGRPMEGIKWFERMLDLEPTNPLGHYQIALVFDQTGQYFKAIDHLKQAVKYRPDFSDAWLRMASIYRQKGNQTEAELVFYRGFIKCPESPAYNLAYARRLTKEKNFKQAIPILEKSIELNPNEAMAYIDLASALFALNRMEDGLKSLEKALEVEPGNSTGMATMCLYGIVQHDRKMADYWLNEIEKHPRIDISTRRDLKNRYDEAFKVENISID